MTQAKGGCGGGGIRGGRTWSRGEDVGGVTSSMRARTRRRATHTHAFTLAKRLPKAGAAGVAPNAEVPVAPNAGAVAAGVPKPGLAPKALVGLMPTVGLTAPKAPERCRSGQRSGAVRWGEGRCVRNGGRSYKDEGVDLQRVGQKLGRRPVFDPKHRRRGQRSAWQLRMAMSTPTWVWVCRISPG